jgi:hypothetical protein
MDILERYQVKFILMDANDKLLNEALRMWTIDTGVILIGLLICEKNGEEVMSDIQNLVFTYPGNSIPYIFQFQIKNLRIWFDALAWEDTNLTSAIVDDQFKRSCMILNDFWLDCLSPMK